MKHDDASRQRQKNLVYPKRKTPLKGVTVFNPHFKRTKASLWPNDLWDISGVDSALEEIK